MQTQMALVSAINCPGSMQTVGMRNPRAINRDKNSVKVNKYKAQLPVRQPNRCLTRNYKSFSTKTRLKKRRKRKLSPKIPTFLLLVTLSVTNLAIVQAF